MSLEQGLQLVPAFVLAFFRLAGMMLAAPLFGGTRIPRRVKALFALVLAASLCSSLQPLVPPRDIWQLVLGIGGELVFGLAIGTALNFIFVAVHWAGDIIGQQLGFGLGQMYDPNSGTSGSAVSDLYFLFTLVLFLLLNGHIIFLQAVRGTFDTLPLLSVVMGQSLLTLVIDLLHSATTMALQLSAPVLVTMLVTDVVLGFLSKTVPQVNVMTAGLSIRALVGMAILVLGLTLTSDVIRGGLLDSLYRVGQAMTQMART